MEFVEHLKSSVDIVKVVGEYVRLRKTGVRWVGLCPFHNEKTPSFGVNSTHQFYKCFGCGVGGDVLKFVMEIERITFFEALKLLAERHGIPMPQRNEYSDPESRLKAALLDMHEAAGRLYRETLLGAAGGEGRAYLEKRGIPAAVAEEFGLGFAQRSGNALTRRFEQEGRTPEQLEASGLVSKRQDGSGHFDRFRGRLIFPIHNESGRIIAFAGRALAAGDEPKYLNSAETPIYRKSQVLYNLHRAKDGIRKLDHAILVEGYMDVIGVSAAGVKQVVASCGTALTNQQVRAIKRHSERIVVNFDPDAAGANAAERSIQMLLDESMHVTVLELDGGLDPDEYVRQRGVEAYRARLAGASSYFHWLADRARARFDMRSGEGRVEAFKFLLPAIQRMSDKLERAAVANDVAGYLGVEPSLVLDQFRKSAADRRTAPAPGIDRAAPPSSDTERWLLRAVLASPEVRDWVLPKIKELPGLERLATRKVFAAILALHEGGARFGYAEVEARLEDSDKSLLSTLILADRVGEQEDHQNYSLERARVCLETLELSDRENSKSSLRARVKAAESAGDMAEALRLTEELSRLERDGAQRQSA